MTVRELAEQTGFEIISLPFPEKQINGAYAGDLLSWVMGRAEQGNCWATIMTNINVLAVASLIDLSCVLICESSEISDEIKQASFEKGVNLIRTELSVYKACLSLGKLI